MKYTRILLIVLAVLTFSSCSKFNKLLKSPDVDAKYAKALEYFYARDYGKANTLFNDILPNTVGTFREDTVMFYMGKSLFNSGEYDLASEMMDSFRNKFLQSSFLEESEFIYAFGLYKAKQTAERDQTATQRAIIAFNEYLNRYPESVKADDVRTMIIEMMDMLYFKTYNNAAIYYKLGQYNAAVTALRSALKRSPEIPYKQEMMYLICKSWYAYAEGSIEGRQLDRYLKMMDSYYNYKTEYPGETKYDKELAQMFANSKEYTEENGVQVQALEKNTNSIDALRSKIAEEKDKILETENWKERKTMRQGIREQQAKIAKLRQENKTSKKQLTEKQVKEDQRLKNKPGTKQPAEKQVKEDQKPKGKTQNTSTTTNTKNTK